MAVRTQPKSVALESELPCPLENAVVERGVDLTEARAVDVLRVPDREVRVIQDVEGLEPKLDTDTLLKPRPLDQRRVYVPVTWTIDGCQAQAAKRSRCRVRKDGRAGSSICCDPRGIKQQGKARAGGGKQSCSGL